MNLKWYSHLRTLILNQEYAFFADGITEEFINGLA